MNVANKALHDIIYWLESNNLKINTNKTKFMKYMTYNNKNINDKIDIKYNNDDIELVNNINFLGITIDQFCNWKLQIDSVCKKVNKFMFALRKIRNLTNIETALTVYHSHVCSILRYGVIIWGNSTDSQRAFIAQKKCIRSIFGLKWTDSCRPLFIEHNLLTLPSLYLFEMFKFVRNNPKLFNKDENAIFKRKIVQKPLVVPRYRLKMCDKNCYKMAINIYNKLPNEFRELRDNEFKNKMYRWLCDKCFYSIDEYFKLKF